MPPNIGFRHEPNNSPWALPLGPGLSSIITVTIATIIATASAVPCAHRCPGAGSSCGQSASAGRATWRGKARLRGAGRARNGRETIARGGGRGALIMVGTKKSLRVVVLGRLSYKSMLMMVNS